MKALLNKLDALIGGIVALLFVAALIIATLGILSRYALSGVTLDWTGEIVVFLIIWAVLLSVARMERRSEHIRVEFLFDKLPVKARRVAVVVSTLIGLGISFLLIWSGWLVVSEAIQWDERTPSTLRVPLWVYYTALSVSGVLNVVFLIERLCTLGQDGKPAGPTALSD